MYFLTPEHDHEKIICNNATAVTIVSQKGKQRIAIVLNLLAAADFGKFSSEANIDLEDQIVVK